MTEPQRYPWPLDRLAAGVFVGRVSELQELRRAFDETLGGRVQVHLVAGEPGSGKTATAEQLLTSAHIRGAEVLRAHCHEGEGAPDPERRIRLVAPSCGRPTRALARARSTTTRTRDA